MTVQNAEERLIGLARHQPLECCAALIQQYPHQLEQAENGEQAKLTGNNGRLRLQDLISVQANDLHGRGAVSEETRKSSEKLKNLTTINNWFNVGTTVPFLGSLFSPLGPFIGAGLTAAASIGLLGVSNIAGERAAARNSRNRGSSAVYLGLFGAVSFTLTGISGVGTLLMLEQDRLEDELAQNVLEEYIEVRLQEELTRREQDPLLIEKIEECDHAREKILKLPAGSQERQDTYEWNMGRHGTPPEYWEGRSFEQLPTCRQAERLLSEINQQRQTITAMQTRLAEQGAISTLRQQNPELFAQHFTEDGQIKSGSDAIRIALAFMWQKLIEPDLMALGSSFVALLISFLLTVGTILLLLQHAENKDVQVSYDLTVKRVRDQFFTELVIAIQNLPED